jgi:hypothetical protein
MYSDFIFAVARIQNVILLLWIYTVLSNEEEGNGK